MSGVDRRSFIGGVIGLLSGLVWWKAAPETTTTCASINTTSMRCTPADEDPGEMVFQQVWEGSSRLTDKQRVFISEYLANGFRIRKANEMKHDYGYSLRGLEK